MTNNTFDPKWPHGWVDTDGHRVVKLEVYPFRGGYNAHFNSRGAMPVDWDGVCSDNPRYRLTNAPAPSHKVRGWVNVYRDGVRDETNKDGYGPGFWPTRAEADEARRSRPHLDRIACICIEREVTEGDGL